MHSNVLTRMRSPGFLIGRVLDFLENDHTVCEVMSAGMLLKALIHLPPVH